MEKEREMTAIAADRLQRLNLPPVRWVVKGLLPQGAAVLSASSKVGKSWMALDLAIAVAQGTQFLGRECSACGVLYLALEDSYNRLRDRLGKLLGGAAAPKDLALLTDCMTMDDDGFGEMLRGYAKGHPGLGLVIVDTLQRIRGSAGARESMYAQDYREMGALKALADELGVCMLFVHHNRKMPDETDPFNLISGSTGIMGVADTVWVITKKKRTEERATLHVTGRDVLQESLALRFDKEQFRWRYLGTQEQVRFQEEETLWRRNPLGGAIRALLSRHNGEWAGTATQLLEALNAYSPQPVAEDPHKLGFMLRKAGNNLARFDSIVYEAKPGPSTNHCFVTKDALVKAMKERGLEVEDT